MPFGLSFGANKTKGSSTTDVNKTETTDQLQSGLQSTQGSTTTTGSSATTTGQQSTGATQTQQATTGTQQTQQQTTQFSAPVLSSLESTVQSLLGTIPGQPAKQGGSFDHAAFVSQGVEAAQASQQTELDASLNSIFDNVGGRDDQNSMATLLANRARGDAAANVAGVRSQLEGQAQNIDSQRFQNDLSGVGQQESFISQVLAALKGGQATTTGATTTAENTTGGTTAQQSQTGTSNTTTNQEQLVNQITAMLQSLQGTTNTVGTEATKTKGSNVGGGFGLSI